MRRERILRLLFVLYCIEAGLALTVLPWTAAWDAALVRVPWIGARAFGVHPLLRSLLTGFGLVHLVWAAHDLDLLLSGWSRR